jgi:putative ABC transport system permease protein
VIRAVGGTKSQVIRLVLAEALALGLLGSVMGVALGLHSAGSANVIAASLIGFDTGVTVPWSRLFAAVALTLVVCLLAGAAPARYAARNNIVDAMSAA